MALNIYLGNIVAISSAELSEGRSLTPVDWFSQTFTMPIDQHIWLRTREMTNFLGMHRNTLENMIRSGLLKDGIHRRKINPIAPRGEFLWNRDVVLMTLGRL